MLLRSKYIMQRYYKSIMLDLLKVVCSQADVQGLQQGLHLGILRAHGWRRCALDC